MIVVNSKYFMTNLWSTRIKRYLNCTHLWYSRYIIYRISGKTSHFKPKFRLKLCTKNLKVLRRCSWNIRYVPYSVGIRDNRRNTFYIQIQCLEYTPAHLWVHTSNLGETMKNVSSFKFMIINDRKAFTSDLLSFICINYTV